MLRKIRIITALLCFFLITLLFLDYTGAVHAYFGFLAKIQFIPALLSLSLGIIGVTLLLTWILGRVYCSVICPLGVFQDGISHLAGKFKKNRFSYTKEHPYLRYGILALLIFAFVMGFSALISLFEPYSAYGRIASQILGPIYKIINNILAYFSERMSNYAFYPTEIYLKSSIPLLVAVGTLVIIGVWSWFKGRAYCNTLCPVGSLLGLVSRYAWIKPVIHTQDCIGCTLCARRCKASCIDPVHHQIDYSRCVSCMDCIENCTSHALVLRLPWKQNATQNASQNAAQNEFKEADIPNKSRRKFMSATALSVGAAAASHIHAQSSKLVGNIQRQTPIERKNPILPPGSLNQSHLEKKCTACQLCISSCPNKVLRPSSDLSHWMQPIAGYERGYCKPDCTLCSEVCPTGAITLLKPVEKTSLRIGRALWIPFNCIVHTDGVNCGNCARHCPNGAITMVPSVAGDPTSLLIPAIHTERCTGCGRCEYLCPSRPCSAIYVEGLQTQTFL